MTGRRRGVTLVEALVASAILSVIALMLLATAAPIGAVASSSAVEQDLDAVATRLLTQLRREVRQSGFAQDGTPQVSSPAEGTTSSTLTFRIRTGLGPTDWSDEITIQGAANEGGGGQRVTRSQGGVVTELAPNVREVTFQRPLGGGSVIVTLVLSRPRDGAAVEPSVRTFVERIEMLNPPP